MQIYKKLLGTNELQDKVINYYVIQRENCYGIELEEKSEDQIICDGEYFTHAFQEAYDLASAMKNGLVTLVSMVNIIDDYIC